MSEDKRQQDIQTGQPGDVGRVEGLGIETQPRTEVYASAESQGGGGRAVALTDLYQDGQVVARAGEIVEGIDGPTMNGMKTAGSVDDNPEAVSAAEKRQARTARYPSEQDRADRRTDAERVFEANQQAGDERLREAARLPADAFSGARDTSGMRRSEEELRDDRERGRAGVGPLVNRPENAGPSPSATDTNPGGNPDFAHPERTGTASEPKPS
jgi:hypothetical protein